MAQALSRVRITEARAAELLRILYKVPDGFGERIYSKSVCQEMMNRRALESELPTDRMNDGGTILWRPSSQAALMIRRAADLLLAMKLAVRRAPGVLMITESGRKECELWYPELRVASNNREPSGWTPPTCGDTVDM